MTEPRHTNRLADRASPYLLQHAHNPVDWYPWGEEAIEAARARDVPIFLSVGYSTCYWCHVMERESFEHEPTAALMNEHFVCVKVDREERPDIDELAMAATVTMTGQGGWPTSVFLEPTGLRPFFCGTYFPREPRHGIPAFAQVLGGMSTAWKTQRDDVLQQAEQIAAAVREQLGERREPVAVGVAQIARTVQSLLQVFDRTNGGFGGAPKFPQPALVDFLLDASSVTDPDTRIAIDHAVRTTLDAMMLGGIHDHAGGGFHRYAVDATWTVPHFEKMLYDNAQLLGLYARAAAHYADPLYRRTALRIAGYVRREMTSEDGAFLSAQDAEVAGREGLNYLWDRAQLDAALDGDDADFAAGLYGIDAGTNFRDPHHPDEPASNVLRLAERLDRLAEEQGTPIDALLGRIGRIEDALLRARAEREQPSLDDKVITAWNGMMIGALADAAASLDEPGLYESAQRAAAWVREQHWKDGALLRSSRAGVPGPAAVMEDYASLARAFTRLAVHAGRFAPDERGGYVAAAAQLAEAAERVFGAPDGGYFDTPGERPDLFARARSTHDGATPSGVGTMLHVLIDLANLTGRGEWLTRAGRCLASVSAAVAENPVGPVRSTAGLLRLLPAREELGGVVELRDTPGEPAAPAPSGPQAFEVFASTDRVRVTRETPGVFEVMVRVRPGYHVLAAEPDPDGELGEIGAELVPLRVGLVSGQGVAIYADYPEGEAVDVPEMPGVRAHGGDVSFRVAVEFAEGVGAGPGRPVLGLTAQACTDRACRAPTTVELDVAIDLED